MHDEILLSYIGLSVLEVKVLKSIFVLAPKLNENYTLIPPRHIVKADVILVNADDPDAIRKLKILSQTNKVTASLMLSNQENLSDGDITVQRPIRVQKLITALEEIVEKTSTDITESGDSIDMRILVVDDSYPVRKYMEHKLTELIPASTKIYFASSGEEAITRVGQQSYDLIFLDVMMEGMDGYKVSRIIKAKTKSYIVMLTSKKSPFDKIRGTLSGCDAYITKPPADERLVDEINKCLARLPQRDGKIAEAQAH